MEGIGVPDAYIDPQIEAQQRLFGAITGDAPQDVVVNEIRGLIEMQMAGQGDEATIQQMVDQQAVMLTSTWFRSFLMFDPRPSLEQVTVPVLAVNGSLDLQVPPDPNLLEIDAALSRAGNRDVTALEFEGLNHLMQESATGSIAGGLFRQLLPDGGGTADDVVEWFDNAVRAACWDGSFGWVVTQGALVTAIVHVGAPALAARLEGHGGFPVAATNAGLLDAEPVGDGSFSLSGSVPFNSGCDGAAGLMVQFMLPDRPPGIGALRLAYAPRARWEIVRDWDVTGLRGTGSHSTAAHGLVVDMDDMLDQFGPAQVDGPTRVLATGENGGWPIAAAVAGTQLGIARRALDEAYGVATAKAPPPTFDVLDSRPTVRRDLMEAEGRWHQAASSLRAALRAAWDAGLAGRLVSDTHRATLSTAAHLANRDSAAIVDTVDRVVGTSSLRPAHPIARCSRDVRPLLGHISCNDAVLGFAAARWRGEDPGNPVV